MLLQGSNGHCVDSLVRCFPGSCVLGTDGSAKGPWALSLWKVLWKEWWAAEVGASGILGPRWNRHLEMRVNCD